MNVLICQTADRTHTVVLVDNVVTMDSQRAPLLQETVDLVDTFRRIDAHVTLATLPKGRELVVQ